MIIGNKIKSVCNEVGMSYSEFARRVGMTPQNANALFKRERVSTVLLKKVNKVLNHDFFADLSDGETINNDAKKSSVSNEAPKQITQLLVSLDGSIDALNSAIVQLTRVNSALS